MHRILKQMDLECAYLAANFGSVTNLATSDKSPHHNLSLFIYKVGTTISTLHSLQVYY